jgi:hypothetical protein
MKSHLTGSVNPKVDESNPDELHDNTHIYHACIFSFFAGSQKIFSVSKLRQGTRHRRNFLSYVSYCQII